MEVTMGLKGDLRDGQYSIDPESTVEREIRQRISGYGAQIKQ